MSAIWPVLLRLRERRWAMAALVFVVYSALTIPMTWPLAARLTTHLAGTGSDLWVHWWNLNWLKKIVLEGGDPFYTRLLFYPHGLSLVYHNFAWLHFILWFPLQFLCGEVAAYNLVYLLTFGLCGLSMFLLVRELTESSLAAFVAGLVYAFWPYTHSHFNHTNMIAVQWLPLVLLGMRRIVHRGRIRDAMFTAAFLFLTGLARWHHFAFGSVIFGLYLLWSLWVERASWRWRTVGLLALAGLVAAMALLPLAWPLLSNQLTSEHPEDIFVKDTKEGQADLLAYFVPPPVHPVWGKAVSPVYRLFDANRDKFAYVGYVALALAAYGLVRCWSRARFWLLVAVAVLVVALGSNLSIAGHIFSGVPMPYRLLEKFFLFRLMRQADRFNIVMGFPVAVLVGWGIVALAKARPRWRIWATACASVLILFDYVAMPYATVVPYVPEWYRQLADEAGDFGILPIPMGAGNSKDYMLYQTVHGKPTVTGETARPPREAFELIESNPLLRGIYETREFDPTIMDVSRQLRWFSGIGVRYLVLHPQMNFTEGRVERWRDWLIISPAYEDDEVIVYYTAPEYGRDFDFVAELGDGIGLITGTLSAQALPQDGLLEADLRWGTRSAPTGDWLVRMMIVSQAGAVAQMVDVEPCAGWPTSEWDSNAVARGKITLRIDPFTDGGRYTVMLALVDPRDGALIGEGVPLGQVEVQAVARVFDAPAVSEPTDATFGDAVQLVGYDLSQDDGSLTLVLHWHALQRMDEAYKAFVHLLDPKSGELITQTDVMLGNWGYPTHWWEAGEFVSDAIPLTDVPQGTYHLVVGLYDPSSGERLLVQVAGEVPSDSLFLQGVTVP